MKNKIMILIILSFLFSFITIFTIPSISHACSCAYPPDVEQEFEGADEVFSGEVIKIVEQKELFGGNAAKRVLFEVNTTWKGTPQTQFIITTGIGGGDCGYDFQVGEEYLVYAYLSSMYGNEGDLVTTICNGTKDISIAQNDLAFLGEGKEPVLPVNLEDELSGGSPLVKWIVAAALLGIGLYFFRKKLG